MPKIPDLEIVDVRAGDSFKAWAHGYPYRAVRWHFHPEYEINLVTATHGRTFVGDHIGSFSPGNLTLTGPNLPHNWLSDVPAGTSVPERCLVLQFTEVFAQGCIKTFPELSFLPGLLDLAKRGLQFSTETGLAAEPIMRKLVHTEGAARLAEFFSLLEVLRGCSDLRLLASIGYRASPGTYMSNPLNHVLDHIERNLASDLRESELAELSGYSLSAFSRAFQRHTGMTFVHYVNSMRINHACEMLISGKRRITDICYDVGFNNLSNFNRQFLAHKAMAPRVFRDHYRENAVSDGAALRKHPAGSQSSQKRKSL